MPSEWMPVVFDHQDPNYQSEEEIREIVGAMLAFYNNVSSQAEERAAELPPGYEINDDAMANFDIEAPLRQWATGFRDGYAWMGDSWEHVLYDEAEEELSASLLILTFFADRQFAEEFFELALHDGVSTFKERTFEEFAARTLEFLPDAIENYAAMGRALAQTLMKLGLYEKAFAREQGLGRNDPCPCGSGKKFKKCCLN